MTDTAWPCPVTIRPDQPTPGWCQPEPQEAVAKRLRPSSWRPLPGMELPFALAPVTVVLPKAASAPPIKLTDDMGLPNATSTTLEDLGDYVAITIPPLYGQEKRYPGCGARKRPATRRVAVTRKVFSTARKAWTTSSAVQPVFTHNVLEGADYTYSQFTLKYAHQQYALKVGKGKRKNQSRAAAPPHQDYTPLDFEDVLVESLSSPVIEDRPIFLQPEGVPIPGPKYGGTCPFPFSVQWMPATFRVPDHEAWWRHQYDEDTAWTAAQYAGFLQDAAALVSKAQREGRYHPPPIPDRFLVTDGPLVLRPPTNPALDARSH